MESEREEVAHMTEDEAMEMAKALSVSQAEEESRNQWDLGSAAAAASSTPLATDVPAGQKIDYCVTKICVAC
eukprot:12700273-Heterocapsa_arctica.AAC.1